MSTYTVQPGQTHSVWENGKNHVYNEGDTIELPEDWDSTQDLIRHGVIAPKTEQ